MWGLVQRLCMASMDCSNVGQALRDEWATLVGTRRARDALAGWVADEPALTDLSSFKEVVDAITVERGEPIENSIAVTQAVVRLAESEELARRLMIHIMVPTIATECHRSLRILRQIHLQYNSRIRPTGADVVDLVLTSAAEAVACYAGRTLPYPIRTIRSRMIEVLVDRRTKLIRTLMFADSLSPMEHGASAPRASDAQDSESNRSWLVGGSPSERPAASVLAETLETAIDLGIVSAADAGLVWATRYHQRTSLDLGGGDKREAERLRRRRSRAQQRLVAHRSELLATGIAV